MALIYSIGAYLFGPALGGMLAVLLMGVLHDGHGVREDEAAQGKREGGKE